ncbi:MAG: hypothetical protein ABJF07_01480 [Nisaea sp.]|uniref:hypothetical protein n=1 Tax=Nisaea sp. TaxID=2024842 RepID=UPI000462BA36
MDRKPKVDRTLLGNEGRLDRYFAPLPVVAAYLRADFRGIRLHLDDRLGRRWLWLYQAFSSCLSLPIAFAALSVESGI